VARPWDEEFSAIVTARYSAYLRTAYLLCADHQVAEDLLQGVLARTYLAWPRLRQSESIDAYVRRALVNARTSRWRRGETRELSVSSVPERAVPPEERVVDRSVLVHHLAALPPRQRAVVVLRYYEDLSEAEAAAVLGCSVGTVKSQAARGLASLRQRMSSDDRREVRP
jgi:RNA polymerase sigma-70 factor (ECF subfamily)